MSDPYSVLGVDPGASDAELRAAYRRLVKLHHPDHNGGSAEAARRFEAVQEAFAEVQRRRARSGPTSASGGAGRAAGEHASTGPNLDPESEARLADLERQVREAHRAREEALRAARGAAREAARASAEPSRDGTAGAGRERPSDEELGYVSTDDSVWKILADARAELSERFADAREHPVARSVSDLVAGLEELADKLDRPPRGRK